MGGKEIKEINKSQGNKINVIMEKVPVSEAEEPIGYLHSWKYQIATRQHSVHVQKSVWKNEPKKKKERL